MPIIGADFLRHFGLLVDLGEMQLLARKGSWSQHLVDKPSGSGLFATIGVVTDRSPRAKETSALLPTWRHFLLLHFPQLCSPFFWLREL